MRGRTSNEGPIGLARYLYQKIKTRWSDKYSKNGYMETTKSHQMEVYKKERKRELDRDQEEKVYPMMLLHGRTLHLIWLIYSGGKE